MNLFQRMLNVVWEQKASAAGDVLVGYQSGRPAYSGVDYKSLNKEGYQKCMAVYACVERISNSVAHVPLNLYRGKVEIEDDENHPLLKRLQRPNPWTPGYLFWKSFVAFRLLNGNSYLERILRDSKNEATTDPNSPQEDPVLELWFHRPDMMKVQPSKYSTPEAYVLENAGKKKEWKANPITGESDILHWKTFNPTDLWNGQSPLATGIDAMMAFNKANDWNKHLLDNVAQPNGAFVYKPNAAQPGGMSQIQMDTLRKDLEEKLSGPKNARRPLILNGLEWQTMSLTPLEMDWLNGKDSSIRDICNIFGVPAQMLGLKDAQTYSNYAEARQAFYMETVLPMLDELCDVLNHWLIPLYGDDLMIKPDHDDVDALAPSRYEYWDKVNGNNFLTINEKRDAVGYEEIPDGDVIMVPSTQVPLEQAVTPPPDPVEMAGAMAAAKQGPPDPAKPPADKPAPFGKKSRIQRIMEMTNEQL
jgi:HK97 family phage portal protein